MTGTRVRAAEGVGPYSKHGGVFMDVVYFGDRRVYRDFETAILSLLNWNPEARIWTLTEDPDPFYDLPVRNFVWRWQDYFNETPTRTKWGVMGPIRAAFTKVLPLDRVISLDVDTIVRGDISELWELDLQGCHVAMCREEYLSAQLGRPYWNNGVCVMDLRRIREDGVDDKMIEELNTVWHPYVGQDAMQMYCRVLDLGSQWNCSKFTAPCADPVIVHYADRTDWRELEEVRQYRRR